MTDRQALEQIARITSGEDQVAFDDGAAMAIIQQIANEALATPYPPPPTEFETLKERFLQDLTKAADERYRHLAAIQAAAEPVRAWLERYTLGAHLTCSRSMLDTLLDAIGKPEAK